MPSYKAPVDDVMFLLQDVFQIERYNNLPGFADCTPDMVEAILGEGAKLAEEVFQPSTSRATARAASAIPTAR